MPFKDPEKQLIANRVYLKTHYQNNKEYYYEKKSRRIKELRAFVDSLKTNQPCKDCRNVYPPCAMDFDHLDGSNKIDSVAQLVNCGLSKEKILLEINKCELVCAVCHRIRTFKRYETQSLITK